MGITQITSVVLRPPGLHPVLSEDHVPLWKTKQGSLVLFEWTILVVVGGHSGTGWGWVV